MTTPAQLAAARRSRYANRKRAEDPAAARRAERERDQRQRQRLIESLGGECCRCGLRDHRGLVVVQPAGQQLRLHQLYTLMINDPDLAHAELRLLCATCRQIELYEHGRVHHQAPSVAPSISSPEVQPSASDAQPSSSSAGGRLEDFGAWDFSDADGVAFG